MSSGDGAWRSPPRGACAGTRLLVVCACVRVYMLMCAGACLVHSTVVPNLEFSVGQKSLEKE